MEDMFMNGPAVNALEIIRDIYNVDQLLSGKEYIRELVKRLAQKLKVKFVMVGHDVEGKGTSVQTDYLFADGKFVDNVVYELEGTPCTKVLCGTRVNCYSAKVQDQFPNDQMLKDLEVESYMGAPFLHTNGGLLGLLVIMDDRPLEDLDLATAVVEFFAARIGAEYRRLDAEESLRRSNEDLEKLVDTRTKQLISQEKLATIGRITLGIAHELKNPLNIIINGTELLQDSDISEQDRARTQTMIHQHGLRANEIITSMLKQARQEVHTTEEWADVSRLLKHAFDVFFKSLNDIELKLKLIKKISITTEVKAQLFDVPAIERVFINVIDNAVYALAEKLQKNKSGYTPELQIELSFKNSRCQIRVRDNGIGIPSDQLKRVCDEFYTTKPPGDGIGLGLWVAKQNIEKNRGSLKIDSRENEYTEVVIELPAVRRDAEVEVSI
ncbi:hypothetical protein CIK05_06375 [Bdellovibrio sp. qaytius]|nr:hypothetical protein CIK05_06375 [Bdellovibrio sp. qaytius]